MRPRLWGCPAGAVSPLSDCAGWTQKRPRLRGCFAEGRFFKNSVSRGGVPNLSAPHGRSAGAHPGRRYSVLPECDHSVGATVPIGLSECGQIAGATGRMYVTAWDATARFVFGEKVVPLLRSGCGRKQSPAQPPTSST